MQEVRQARTGAPQRSATQSRVLADPVAERSIAFRDLSVDGTYIYVSTNLGIIRFPLAGGTTATYIIGDATLTYSSLDVDETAGKIYYIAQGSPYYSNSRIRRCDIDGSNDEEIQSYGPNLSQSLIRVHEGDSQYYWTAGPFSYNAGSLLKGTDTEHVLGLGRFLDSSFAIAEDLNAVFHTWYNSFLFHMHHVIADDDLATVGSSIMFEEDDNVLSANMAYYNGWLYYTHKHPHADEEYRKMVYIRKSEADGSNDTLLVDFYSDPGGAIKGLAIDTVNNKIIFGHAPTEGGGYDIWRCDLDGTNQEKIVESPIYLS